MCGQTGIILAESRRTARQFAQLRSAFTRLLLLNELRGRDATGIAMVVNNGTYRLMKRPMPASSFIRLPKFHEVLDSLSNQNTLVMGHTRLATVGRVDDVTNGHPIKAGCCLATVNGTIYNANRLFRKFGLTRFAEVDSELVARLADQHAPNGEILVGNFLHALRHCRGQISAVVTSLFDPQRVIILKGNRPLSLRYHAGLGALVYSSDAFHMDTVLRTKAWTELELPPMTCAVADLRNLPEPQLRPFNFKRIKLRTTSCAI